LQKNRSFGKKKVKFLENIEIMAKKEILANNWNFGQKSKSLSKSIFWSKIKIFVKIV